MDQNINSLLQFINDNPWLNILFIILTLFSIFLSIYFYFKSKKSKIPTFTVRTINLIKESINKIEAVDIFHKGTKIQNLSISKFAIWNSGKETISYNDVANNDKLRIEINPLYNILEFDLIHQQNVANDFNISQINEYTLEIQFDYFDFNEGIVVQIYHDAPEEDLIILRGSIKGSKDIIKSVNSMKILPSIVDKKINDSLKNKKLVKRILSFVSFLLPILLIYSLFQIGRSEKVEVGIYTKIMFSIFTIIPYWWLGYRIIKRRVPKGFDIFEDEF